MKARIERYGKPNPSDLNEDPKWKNVQLYVHLLLMLGENIPKTSDANRHEDALKECTSVYFSIDALRYSRFNRKVLLEMNLAENFFDFTKANSDTFTKWHVEGEKGFKELMEFLLLKRKKQISVDDKNEFDRLYVLAIVNNYSVQ